MSQITRQILKGLRRTGEWRGIINGHSVEVSYDSAIQEAEMYIDGDYICVGRDYELDEVISGLDA